MFVCVRLKVGGVEFLVFVICFLVLELGFEVGKNVWVGFKVSVVYVF